MAYAAYNQGLKYNRVPYNTRYVTVAIFAARAPGVGNFDSNLTGAFVLEGSLSGEGILIPKLSRDDKLSAWLEGFGRASATVLRLVFERSQLEGIGGLKAGSEVFTIMRFLNGIAADEVVIIDSNDIVVTLNDEFWFEGFTGQLLSLEPGKYRIEYSDGETSRTLQIDIEYINKFK